MRCVLCCAATRRVQLHSLSFIVFKEFTSVDGESGKRRIGSVPFVATSAVPVRPYVWRRPPAAGHHLLGTIYLILNITHHISHRKFSAYRVLSMCKEDGSNEYKCW